MKKREILKKNRDVVKVSLPQDQDGDSSDLNKKEVMKKRKILKNKKESMKKRQILKKEKN